MILLSSRTKICFLLWNVFNFLIREKKTRIYVAAREYYCYKLQIRPNEFNVLFHGGMLFQQFLVDIYVKVESMRLDRYSLEKHKKNNTCRSLPGILNLIQVLDSTSKCCSMPPDLYYLIHLHIIEAQYINNLGSGSYWILIFLEMLTFLIDEKFTFTFLIWLVLSFD